MAMNRSGKMREKIVALLWESSRTLRDLASESADIERAAAAMARCFRRKGKVVSFGNGGSAADAQHLAAELCGRFERERKGLPAVALTTNTSAITAIANDYDYDQIFVRQVEGFVGRGDVAVAISTSGNSANVLAAAKLAKKRGAFIVAWTGRSGGKLKSVADVCLRVPSDRTARIQEGHLALLHTLCSLVEEDLFPRTKRR
ncbi:MAG TPA: SIS domain-containing protein [Elusimicrobiota bacterium]|nr:SIS domain-containing protein [Elusimicrobiota bacterium]